MTGYDIEWRQDEETTWETYRSGPRERFTIAGLQSRALYWVRVRGVETDGDPNGATQYTTAWSAPAAAIVGDWTPRGLRVVPDHGSLIITWGDVAVASRFEVQYWPLGRIDEITTAQPRRGGDGWFARIGGLEDGEPYGIAVRSARRATVAADGGMPAGEVTLISAPATTAGRPGGFTVADVEPRFVAPGAAATITLRLVDSAGEALANTLMGAVLRAGPTFDAGAATAVTCGNGCRTDSDGSLTLTYRTASPTGEERRGNIDLIRVYWDTDEDGSYNTDTDPFATASVFLFRPVNYVALGDSYSAGENGSTAAGDFTETDESRYLKQIDTGNASDPECRRWSLAYPHKVELSGYPLLGDLTVTAFACVGAVTFNVYDPHDADADGVADVVVSSTVQRPPKRVNYVLTQVYSEAETNRPSVAGAVAGYKVGEPAAGQDGNWEPRQVVSLDELDDELSVDMVTITIGGNDLRFSDLMRACVLATCDDEHFGGEKARRAVVAGDGGAGPGGAARNQARHRRRIGR